jgi:menaquinone-dependent protoporphyrinogen oxidase
MSVLVAVASRHGATQEIAESIGKRIHSAGFAVDVIKLVDPAESGSRPDPADYEAVILGSAVYLGRWLGPAREFAADHAQALAVMPVWAFGSGPVGEGSVSDAESGAVPALLARINPIEYRLFPGRVERDRLGRAEHLVVSAIRIGDEDDRDWDQITSWADGISQSLRAGATARA